MIIIVQNRSGGQGTYNHIGRQDAELDPLDGADPSACKLEVLIHLDATTRATTRLPHLHQ